MPTTHEKTSRTKAWIKGKRDAENGRERKAPYGDKELIEAYAAGYDSVEQND